MDWTAEIDVVFEKTASLEAQASQIGEWLEAGEMVEAIDGMDRYLAQAEPEDTWAGIFLGIVMKHYPESGEFSKARPNLAGVISYPASYAAALSSAFGQLALKAAQAGRFADAAAYSRQKLALEQSQSDQYENVVEFAQINLAPFHSHAVITMPQF